MTEVETERRRRRAGVLLGLLALLVIGLIAGFTASLATGASSPPLRVNSTPSTVVMTAGDTATYAVRLTRGSERGAVAFSVAALPPAATASFSPASTTGDTSTLTITTDGDNTDGAATPAATPAGDYDIVLRATGPDAVAGAIVRLKIQDRAMPGTGDLVQVSGTLGTVLRPGAGSGLNVSLTNPGDTTVRLDAVSVVLASLSAPRAAAGRPCTLADFEIRPYAGPAITLTPGQTRTLAQLDVPAAQWPQVRMRNTSVNQDGCQGSTVSFTYGVTGRTT